MLNLLERDYFGLRFVDPNNQRVRIPFLNYLITEDNFSIDYSKVWLDPTKLIYKQVKNITPPIIFCFRVKYYPANPTTLKEELTRYYLYLQLRRDILNQKLHCLSDSTYLMACVLQCNFSIYFRKLFLILFSILLYAKKKMKRISAISMHKTTKEIILHR